MLVQPDGRIVVVGQASTGPPVPENDFVAARYLDTGEPDPTFGDGGAVMTNIAGGSDLACAAVLQPDGKIVVTGRVAFSGGDNPDFGLVRYTAAGGPDPAFGTEGCRGPAAFALARFDDTGVPDPGFGAGGLVTTRIGTGDAVANAVAVQPDGKLVVAGHAVDGGTAGFAVVRYTADGVPDPSFGAGGIVTVDFYGADDRAECVAIQPDGGIVVAGSAVNVRAVGLGLTRLLP